MKALKSELAQAVLRNPENRSILRHAMLHAGYGAEKCVAVIVTPMTREGLPGLPVRVNFHFVPKAG